MKAPISLFILLPLCLSSPTPVDDQSTVPTKSCSDIVLPEVEGLQVLQKVAFEVYDYTPTIVIPGILPATPPLDFCNLTLTLSHTGTDDRIRTTFWLPLTGWNGRLMATGGAGLGAGFDYYLPGPVARGFVTGNTDAGLTKGLTVDPQTGTWILNDDNTIDVTLLENFAHRSLHEMTVIGKLITKDYYGQSPSYSYYSGCSQGGRMGYSAAQFHPDDYDGIMANAPAIYAPKVSVADFWPAVVMANIVAPPQCVFTEYMNSMIEVCDGQDGVVDELPSRPFECQFDTALLVGRVVDCGTLGNITITPEFAEVVRKVVDGPRTTSGEFMWWGITRGANFSDQADTEVTENGTVVAVPFSASEEWIRLFTAQDPDFDTTHLSYAEFEDLFNQSVEKFEPLLGTRPADFAAFRRHGGKFLTWHGLADEAISPGATTFFWKEMHQQVGSLAAVDDFYRLFLAPGVAHCYGGYGPAPVDPLSALMDWVENGTAPDHLAANGTARDGSSIERDLCVYPRMPKYKGHGGVHEADSFTCSC